MKLNWAERLAVNNPLRVVQQRLEIDWMVGRHRIADQGNVLEIGCGRGAAAGLIAAACRPARLVLLDIDPDMIGKAARRSTGIMHCMVADAVRLPFRKSAFDAVFGFGVLHHLEDWQAGLSEIARVLKTGGAYYLEEIYPSVYQNRFTRKFLLHPSQNRFRSRELRQALANTKFHFAACREIRKLGILAVLVKTAA